MKQRLEEIDALRAVAILAMILIHTSYYYINDALAFFLWNISQFAVPVFIFCSTYIYFKKPTKISFFSYALKRTRRLLLPYYAFLLFFIPLVFVKEPGKVTFSYLLNSLLTTGGVDISWLVFLFLVFIVLVPAIQKIAKAKLLLLLFVAIVTGSSVLFLVYKPSLNFRYTMWLPWSIIIVFSYFFAKYKEQKWLYFASFIGSFIIFLTLRTFQAANSHPLSFIENKYPPNLYLISFGIFSILVLHLLYDIGFFVFFKKALHFLSIHSYHIYFIHYIILYILVRYLGISHFTWYSLFAGVLAVTIITQRALNKLLTVRRK